MTIGFNTTKIGYDKMIAACHQADKTARAQILEKSDNPILYNIIEEFYHRYMFQLIKKIVLKR